jgi:hypothetical protein
MSTLIAQAENQPSPTPGPDVSSSTPNSTAATTSNASQSSATTSKSDNGKSNSNTLSAGLVAMGVVLAVLLISLSVLAFCYFRRGANRFSRKRSSGTISPTAPNVELHTPTFQAHSDRDSGSPRSPEQEEGRQDLISPTMSPIVHQLSGERDPVEIPINPSSQQARTIRMSSVDTDVRYPRSVFQPDALPDRLESQDVSASTFAQAPGLSNLLHLHISEMGTPTPPPSTTSVFGSPR